MSVLTKQYTATHISGYQEVIENVVEYIDQIGVRRFITDYGIYFHTKSPTSEIVGHTIFVQWVLEDYRGQIVDPDDITEAYLREYPQKSHFRDYRGFGTQRERRNSKHWYAKFKHQPIHRLMKQMCDAGDIPIRYNSTYHVKETLGYDERRVTVTDRSWKRHRKYQYK